MKIRDRRLFLAAVCGVIAAGIGAGSMEMAVCAETADYYSASFAEVPEIAGLSCTGKMPLSYAQGFDVYLYDGGYKLIDIPSEGQFLIVPEGSDIPDKAADTCRILCAPVENVYLAATSAMSLIDAIGAAGHITMTGTDVKDWHIPAPVAALQNGDMIFAGKYSEPNYELLVRNDCYLAIESTMIYHAPQVREMLEAIDIPVFTDRSSYETSGLGRSEWIKAYGAMFDKEEEAFAVFDKQLQIREEMRSYENTGKSVAFVSINQDGACVIRRPGDYIADMITEGGGQYVFADEDALRGNGATVMISMEEFYAKAADADYLVYNGTIAGAVDGKDALLDKNELFADFKAFGNDQIWQVDASLYQSTDHVMELAKDFHLMLTDGDESRMTFLSRLR